MVKESHSQRIVFESLLPDSEIELEPELKAIDTALEADPSILRQVKEVISQRQRFSKTLGRHSTPVEVVIRLLVIKHLFNWSFRKTISVVKDSFGLRYFARIYLEKVPHYSVLARYEQLIPEDALKKLNDKIVQIAKNQKITKGRKLRVDTTAVETNMHYPTDSSLLSDSVRVISRLFKKVKQAGIASGAIVRDVSRSTKRRVLNIVKFAQGKSEQAQELFKKNYRELIDITKHAVENAKRLKRTVVNRARPINQQVVKLARTVKTQLEHYIPLIENVIEQAERRIFHGESVPNSEKIISIFEPHSYVIRKGKKSKPNEFGQVVKIQEADGKIITDFESYPSQVVDSDLFMPAVEKHIETFNRPPYLAAADRGFYSAENEESASKFGVKRVCLPKKGKKSKERKKIEKSRWFKAGQRFRAGSEGKISVLKRGFGLHRCLNKGQDGFNRWVGWAVIASNLKTIANA